MNSSKPLPYSAIVRQQDTDRAVDTVTVALYPNESRPKAVDFGGSCPRCGHAVQEREWLVAVAAATKMTDQQREALIDRLDEMGLDRSSGDLQFDLTCECGEDHPDRPADKQGCGASFRVRVTWP